MIVASGKATQDNALRYMKAMMEMYQNAYRAMPAPLNPFGFFPGGWSQGQTQEPAQTPGNPGQDSREHPLVVNGVTDTRQSEVTELRRRVEELESALARRNSSGKAKKTKSRRKS